MIKALTITNQLGEEIRLELERPDKSGFIVKSIDGLGPTKANINTTKLAMSDGAKYNSSYLDKRSIVMNLEFYQTSDETIEDIRHKTYKYFPIKRKIKILFETDNRESEIEGFVEANEPNIFSRNEGCSITILCPDPFFYSTKTKTSVFYGIEPNFEFPFSNESLTEKVIEMGLINNKPEGHVYYEGDSDVGFTMIIHALGDASDITIYDMTSREVMSINTSSISDLQAGDTILINTRKGNKKATLIRDGDETNILNCIDKGSKWFTLSKGDNRFAYKAVTGISNIQFSIETNIAYDGV